MDGDIGLVWFVVVVEFVDVDVMVGGGGVLGGCEVILS